MPPKRVKSGPVQDVVLKADDVDLGLLPALHTWPQDGGAFMNLGLTHTKHPETGVRNLGMYRLQRHDAPPQFHYLIGSEAALKPVWKAWYAAPQVPGDPRARRSLAPMARRRPAAPSTAPLRRHREQRRK